MIMAEDKCLYKRTQDLTEKSKTKSSPRKNQHLSWDAEQRSEGRREVANWERAAGVDCGKSIPGRTISSPTVLQQGAQCVQENWRQGDEPLRWVKRKETGFRIDLANWASSPDSLLLSSSSFFLADNTRARHCFKHFTHINSSLTQQ